MKKISIKINNNQNNQEFSIASIIKLFKNLFPLLKNLLKKISS